MELEEMLEKAIRTGQDEQYINIHERTHRSDAIRMSVHLAATHLYHSGYTFETAIEVGMLWVLDAITLYGMPDDLDSLRIPIPTPEEIAEMKAARDEEHDEVENEQEVQGSFPKPPGEGVAPDERAFEKLLGDIDVPELGDGEGM